MRERELPNQLFRERSCFCLKKRRVAKHVTTQVFGIKGVGIDERKFTSSGTRTEPYQSCRDKRSDRSAPYQIDTLIFEIVER